MKDSKNLSQEDHDTLSTRRTTTNGVLLCSLVQFARIVLVHVILIDDVLGVIVDVLIGHDIVLVIDVAIFVVIFCIWRCTLYMFCIGRNHMCKETFTVCEPDVNQTCPIAAEAVSSH